jgi:hypothetical protein
MCPFGIGDCHAHGVAQACEFGLVAQEVLDVGMLGRDGFLEAGIELQPCRLPAEQRGY